MTTDPGDDGPDDDGRDRRTRTTTDEPDDEDEDADEDEDEDGDEDGDDRALPGTGGPSSALLALGLLGVGLGGATIAYGRRPRSMREQG